MTKAARLFWIMAGFIVWSIAFVALYAILSVGCRFSWHEVPIGGAVSLQYGALWVALGVMMAIGGAVLVLSRRGMLRSRDAGEPVFLDQVAFGGAVAALAATVFSLGPALFLSACI